MSSPPPASYQVEVTHQSRREVRRLPGNVRQRVLRTLRGLARDPRPSNSESLAIDRVHLPLVMGADLRRIRLANWRIVYLVDDDLALVTVLAIRKRPPYQYEDLTDLIAGT